MRIKVSWLAGAAAHDWEKVAKKENLNLIQTELLKLEESIHDIHLELQSIRRREEIMRNINGARFLGGVVAESSSCRPSRSLTFPHGGFHVPGRIYKCKGSMAGHWGDGNLRGTLWLATIFLTAIFQAEEGHLVLPPPTPPPRGGGSKSIRCGRAWRPRMHSARASRRHPENVCKE